MSNAHPPRSSSRHQPFEWSLHNPGLLDRETLIGRFLIRQELLDELVRQVRLQPTTGGLRHILCIGQRGMGKTTLLRRLCYFIEDDAQLHATWLPILLPEEQYAITNLVEFFSDILQRLASQVSGSKAGAAAPANHSVATLQRLLQELDEACLRMQRRIVLIVDNLNDILSNLSELEAHELRRILQENTNLLIVGAAPTYFEEITHYDRPFYDFFRQFRLTSLSDKELDQFLRAVATQQNDQATLHILKTQPARARSLRLLTGGNPRIALFLYRMIAESPNGNIRRDLDRLLDEITPYYKGRIEALKKWQRKIVDCVARKWWPVAEADILQGLGGDEAETRNALRSLLQDGTLERLPESPGMCQLAERMFSIYYLMRTSTSVRQRFEWFVAFLQLFYEQEQLPDLARTWVQYWSQSVEQADSYEAYLTPAEVRDRATSLGLLAQAADTPQLRAAVVQQLLRFTKLAGLTDSGSAQIMNDYLRDAVASSSSPFEAALITIMEQRQTGEALRESQLSPGDDAAGAQSMLQDLEQAVEKSPDDPLAWSELAVARSRRADHAASLFACERAVSLGNRAIDVRFVMANSYLELNRLTEAAPIIDGLLKDLAKQDPHSLSGAWGLRGALLDRQGKFQEAAGALRQAAKIDPTVWQHLQNLANVLLAKLKDFAGAAEALSALVQLKPDSAQFWGLLGIAYWHQRKYVESAAALERSLGLDPDRGEMWSNLVGAKMMSGDAAGAVAAGEKAVAALPRFSAAWSNLSAALERRGDQVRAEQTARRAIDLDPEHATGYVNLASALLLRGDEAEALTALKTAVRLNAASAKLQDDTEAWRFLVDGLLLSEAWAVAELALRQLTAREPDQGGNWHNLALTYDHLKRFPDAVRSAQRATALEPQLAVTWHMLGRLLHKLGQLKDACVALKKAQTLEYDEHVEGAFIESLLFTGDLKLAEARLEKWIQSVPKNADALAMLAMLRLRQQRLDEGAELCEQILALQPDHLSGLSTKAIVSMAKGNYSEALTACRRAATLNPNQVVLCLNVATAAEAQGLFTEAIAAIQSYLKQQPRDLSARTRLLGDLLAAKEMAAAEEELKTLVMLQLAPEADVYNNYGALCAQHGLTERAIEAFQRAVELDSRHPHAFFNLASYYAGQQGTDDAWEAFRQGLAANSSGGTVQRWDVLISVFLNKPDPPGALRLCSMALIQHPAAPRLRLQFAWAQFLNDQLDPALETLAPILYEAPESAMGWLLCTWISWRAARWNVALQALAATLRFLDVPTFEQMQGSLLLIVQRLVRAGHAATIAQLIDGATNVGLAERWQPLRLALEAIIKETEVPLFQAPQELRTAAEQVLQWVFGKHE